MAQAVQNNGAAAQLAIALLTALLLGPDRTGLVSGQPLPFALVVCKNAELYRVSFTEVKSQKQAFSARKPALTLVI